MCVLSCGLGKVAMALSFTVDHGKTEGKSTEHSVVKTFPEHPRASKLCTFTYGDLLYDITALSFSMILSHDHMVILKNFLA